MLRCLAVSPASKNRCQRQAVKMPGFSLTEKKRCYIYAHINKILFIPSNYNFIYGKIYYALVVKET